MRNLADGVYVQIITALVNICQLYGFSCPEIEKYFTGATEIEGGTFTPSSLPAL